jgi:formiminotetrahydrofolate cyclodeaminase
MLLAMTPGGDLSRFTLEQFCREAASQHPMPAGVAIAAVSAGFALGLIAKALAISGRRNTLPENAARIVPLAAAAQAAAQRMLRLADEDTAAFDAYLSAVRLPRATESERQMRQQGIESAVERAIDLPLAAAQEAAAALALCDDASALTSPAMIADLGVAASLLASALRCFLLCAQSNVGQLAPQAGSSGGRVAAAAERHAPALRLAEAVFERIRTALGS